MADDGEGQGRVGEDGGPYERQPLINIQPPHSRFRQDRQPQNADRWSVCSGLILLVFKAFFCSLGLWGHRNWNYILRGLLLMICIAQAGYQIAVDWGCPFFDCSYFNEKQDNKTTKFLRTRKMCFTIFSLAAFFSYSMFLVCLRASRSKVSALMDPSKSVVDVVNGKEITLLFFTSVIIMASFLSGMVLFSSVQVKRISDIHHDNLKPAYVVVAAAVIITHWASFNTCHVFAISSLSLGTFAGDSFRLIWEVRNGTLEDVIAIHEDLCRVVSDTVSVYSAWFMLHWFSFGAGMTVNIILISKEIMTPDGNNNHTQATFKVMTTMTNQDGNDTTLKISLCLILVGVLYLFTLPCFYAARITSKCNGIYERINCTRFEYSSEGHPLRDRRKIALFVSYAKDTSCGFKVGRITFNTSLAWLSFFFGLTALLFHFF